MSDGDFDLLTDGWIPVVDVQGKRQELSLLDCLEQAAHLREVSDPSPLVTFGIYRFFGAMLQTYLPLADEYDWAEVWEAERFPPDLLRAMQQRCVGKLRLFDSKRPFYQSGDISLAEKPAEGFKTVGYLRPEDSTGTNVVHFSHRGDLEHAYCPICCAHGLLVLPPFAMSGGAGIRPSINGVPPYYVLPAGETLFATLMLNYVLPGFQPALASKDDPGPLWEVGGPIKVKDERSRAGFMESLTWPPRRIRLFPGPSGRCSACGRQAATLVRQMVFVQGRSLSKSLPTWDDPWAAFVERWDKMLRQSTRVPLRPREERDVWRDYNSLFLAREDGPPAADSKAERRLRPAVLRQLDELLALRCLPTSTPVHYEVFGLRTDMKAKIFEWRHDHFDFPAVLLCSREATRTIDQALQGAEDVANALGKALRTLHPVSERKSSSAQASAAPNKALVTFWSRRFWQELEHPFRCSLHDDRLIGTMDSQAEWLKDWTRRVHETGRGALEGALDAFESSSDDLRRAEKARAVYYHELTKLRSPAESAPVPAAAAVGGE